MTESKIMKALEKQRDKVVANEVFVFEVIALINCKNAEIERLRENTKIIMPARSQGKTQFLVEKYNDVRSEAIKEFVAELLEKYCFHNSEGEGIVFDTDIYNLAKEMGVEL